MSEKSAATASSSNKRQAAFSSTSPLCRNSTEYTRSHPNHCHSTMKTSPSTSAQLLHHALETPCSAFDVHLQQQLQHRHQDQDLYRYHHPQPIKDPNVGAAATEPDAVDVVSSNDLRHSDWTRPRSSWTFPLVMLDQRLATIGSLLTSRIPFPANEYFDGNDGAGSPHALMAPTEDRRVVGYFNGLPHGFTATGTEQPPDEPIEHHHHSQYAFHQQQQQQLMLPAHLLYTNSTNTHVNPAQLTSENLLLHHQHQQQHSQLLPDAQSGKEMYPPRDQCGLFTLDSSVVSTPECSTVTLSGTLPSLVSVPTSQYVTPSDTRAPSTEPTSICHLEDWCLGPTPIPTLPVGWCGDIDDLESNGGEAVNHTCDITTSTRGTPLERGSADTDSIIVRSSSDGKLTSSGAAMVLPDGTVATSKTAPDDAKPLVPKKRGYSFYSIDKSKLEFKYSNTIELPAIGRQSPVPYTTRTSADVRHEPGAEEFVLTAAEEGEEITAQQPKLGCGDLYTPRYVKMTPKGRFGWCDCGEWLGMKSSVYNYHMTIHGISCRTGQPFVAPEQMRWCTKERIVDAYCGHCNEWINLLRKMMRQVTWKNWFLHASHCHHKAVREKPVIKKELNKNDEEAEKEQRNSNNSSPHPPTAKRARLE